MRQTTSPSGGKGDANKFFPFHCHRFPYQPFATSHKQLLYLDHHGPCQEDCCYSQEGYRSPNFSFYDSSKFVLCRSCMI